MARKQHQLKPLLGTDLVEHGEHIDAVIVKMGAYQKRTVHSDSGWIGYHWDSGRIMVNTDSATERVKWMAFHKGTNLFLGDIPVFESPNLVVLLGMHDPHPLMNRHNAIFTNLGIRTEIPPSEYGYSHDECDDFIQAVVLLSAADVDGYLKTNPPLPAYNWREWIKPNLLNG
jgi:hypothetical protein